MTGYYPGGGDLSSSVTTGWSNKLEHAGGRKDLLLGDPGGQTSSPRINRGYQPLSQNFKWTCSVMQQCVQYPVSMRGSS